MCWNWSDALPSPSWPKAWAYIALLTSKDLPLQSAAGLWVLSDIFRSSCRILYVVALTLFQIAWVLPVLSKSYKSLHHGRKVTSKFTRRDKDPPCTFFLELGQKRTCVEMQALGVRWQISLVCSFRPKVHLHPLHFHACRCLLLTSTGFLNQLMLEAGVVIAASPIGHPKQ